MENKLERNSAIQKHEKNNLKKIKIADGDVVIRDKKFRYEFYTDNKNVYVKIHHPGKNGDVTQFQRNDKINLKTDMDNALVNSGMFK